jgi:hypothetical protein
VARDRDDLLLADDRRRLQLLGSEGRAGRLPDRRRVCDRFSAALLVMRSAAEMQRLGSVGRIVAVVIDALLAIALIRLSPALGWYGLAAVAALAEAAGSHGSRWYLTPGFTTFLVFLLLLYSHPEQAGARFGQRVGETLLGVGLGYVFGLALPALQARFETLARAAPPPP